MSSVEDRIRENAKKGKFKVSTDTNRVDTSSETMVRDQQDIITANLARTKRKESAVFTIPVLRGIKGRQVEIYSDALKSLGAKATLDPDKAYYIDKTGFCPEICFDLTSKQLSLSADYLSNNFVLISPDQAATSIVNARYSFMNKLIDTVNSQFSDTIVSFTRNEAVIGKVTNTVIDKGVEAFLKEGLYKEKDCVDVTAVMSTPTGAIIKLRELLKGVDDIRALPETVTVNSKMQKLYNISSEMKTRHKKLSDLVVPASDSHYFPVTGFRYGTTEAKNNIELYYFKDHKPVFIIFGGEDGTIDNFVGPDYLILDGNNKDKLLNNLLDLGFIDYLVDHVESLRDGYAPKGGLLLSGFKAILGKDASSLPKEWNELNDVATVLRLSDVAAVTKDIRKDYEVLGKTKDLDNMKGQYIRSLSPELKYAILFPKSETEDILLCDLLTRSGPSKALNLYRSIEKFVPYFNKQDDAAKIVTLQAIDKDMHFENQNNLLVNSWLMVNYAKLCSDAGITFTPAR